VCRLSIHPSCVRNGRDDKALYKLRIDPLYTNALRLLPFYSPISIFALCHFSDLTLKTIPDAVPDKH
jgi:hypothetical protein